MNYDKHFNADIPEDQYVTNNRIPIARVMERLDALTGRLAYDEALCHLEYWIRDARAAGDLRGQFTLQCEKMGVCRKMGDRKGAMESADTALSLISSLGIEHTASAGTAYVNAGTVSVFCGEPEKALGHFEKAEKIYLECLPAGDARLGGLYNNMGLALKDLGRCEQAIALYRKALDVMALQPGGRLEQAITYLNMADAAAMARGQEAAEKEIAENLEKAEQLLMNPQAPENSYYAFVCEKCAPVFSYYGWFACAAELTKRAERIRKGQEGKEQI